MVLDFGLSKILDQSFTDSEVTGTALYMAPEMVQKYQSHLKSDLWSIGVIMYECLYGKPIYNFQSQKRIYKEILKRLPITLPTNRLVSPECKDLLLGLLNHDPEERFNYPQFWKHPFFHDENLFEPI